MQEHPVPQPISSYEFRLIGNMTLKQFSKLAGCCLVALVFYALNLPEFLKVPLVVFFVALGAGLAFLPVNERPLDVWIISFFKAVFSPTQYTWRKNPTFPPNLSKLIPIQPISPPGQTTAEPPPPQINPVVPDKSEAAEKQFFQNIQTLFASGPAVRPKVEIKLPLAPEKKTTVVAPKANPNKIVIFSASLPNIISGVVKDKQGKLIDGAILEIKDVQDLSVRALRSNKLGQFRIATPLSNGVYTIITEKEGCEFDIIKIDLKGEIFTPIEVSSK